MWGLLEPEEQLGRWWHRLVGDAASYPWHDGAAVALESVRVALAVFFRALGGAPELALCAGTAKGSGHRLRLRQRLGVERERLDTPEADAERVLLPERIGLFPDPALNRALYFWLAAYFAHAEAPEARPADPLQADLAFLHRAVRTSRRVCAAYPGLAPVHERLCAAVRAARPARRLPAAERAVEALVRHLLGDGDAAPPREWLAALAHRAPAFHSWQAPRGYRPFLPAPLWGEVGAPPCGAGATAGDDGEADVSPREDERDARRRRARRRRYRQSERDDPLVLNRFEKLVTWAQMVNLNRAVDDDEAESARRAAEDFEQLDIAPHQRRAATRLHFDLDLAPADAETAAAGGKRRYPEWDCRRRRYLPQHCSVAVEEAAPEGELWAPDAAARRRIRHVRRQFEALRPRREMRHRELDGSELDMDAVVRARCDLAACGAGSDRVYARLANEGRDLAVAILVDVSLSTDAWVVGHRVLDVEKEALVALALGLTACGDDFGIYTFTSRRRHFVRVSTVKGFDEPLGGRALRRIAALRPGYYTRTGAALRHVAGVLASQPHRHRLLLILTDGKPNDLDHYEGRYGVEDTRRAVGEARRAGLAVFGVTVDRKAQDYFPYLFGRGGYAIVPRADRLPETLPAIYRHLVG